MKEKVNEPEPTIDQLFDLAGRTALVTGATGWLGKSLATALAEAGARVVVSSRNAERAHTLARGLPGRDDHCAVEIDHMNPGSIDEGFKCAVAVAGPVDILVNNGTEPGKGDWRGVDYKAFSRQLDNATGYFHLARLFRNHAVEVHRPANIVLVGSIYGLVGSYPEDFEGIRDGSSPAYHTLKGGVINLTRHLAVLWAPDNIRVNCLSPGPFPKPGFPEALKQRYHKRSPFGRMGSPHELKGAVLLLASDAGSYMTGVNLVVDGGWTAW
jgi:NAD(P)-dependent dehydrogenase (short-subunit alcohol dehydrogenase family)